MWWVAGGLEDPASCRDGRCCVPTKLQGVGDKMQVWWYAGGLDAEGKYRNDAFVLDARRLSWFSLAGIMKGAPPKPRAYHTCAQNPNSTQPPPAHAHALHQHPV